jgi:phytanoyl-CoA hydroxylase
MLTPELEQFYQTNGYVIVPGLFGAAEVARYIEHYMALRRFPREGDTAGVTTNSLTDTNQQYPRMIHMHRWDELSLQWMIDPRLNAVMTKLIGREPYAVQTMLYYKPAGARGQALHQDQFYLKVQPGTCMAAWMALDDCDEANGCLQVVPGSHTWDVLCTQPADTRVSFTDVTVPLPEGQEVRPAVMKAGDVLFFNGSLVHGSYPNTTTDRFRRALIGHYIDGAAEEVGAYYHPALRMNGQPIELGIGEGGGVCGVWVEQDGTPMIELAGVEDQRRKHE